MNLITAIFDWLLAATLRASILAVVIFCLQLLSRRWLPPQWRHAMWLPMLLVLVLPELPGVPYGWSPRRTMERPVILPETRAAASIAVPVVSGTPVKVAMEASARTAVNPFAILWVAGACAMVGAGLIGYRRKMRRIGRTAVAPGEALGRSIASAAREAGLVRVPRVLVSAEVESPAVTGIFRHVLLLPAGFPEGFSAAEARLILLHEFIHLKRHDLTVNALTCGLQALHWFNPILWFAFARMRADREAACDARVLSMDAVDRRAEYGGALLKLEGGYLPSGWRPGFVGIFERTAGMKSRIRQIAGHRPAGLAGRIGGAGLVALLTAFGATKAQEPAAPLAPAEVAGEPVRKTARQDAIERKLDAVIVPNMIFNNGYMNEVMRVFRSATLWNETAVPGLGEVNFVIMKPLGQDPETLKRTKITLDRQNATIRELIEDACKQSGMAYRVEDHAVIFFPAGAVGEMEQVVQPPEPKGPAADFAAKTIIPKIDFTDVTLREAVEVLNQGIRDAAKGGKVYPVVLGADADANAKIRELRIVNAPLAVALGYITEPVKHAWTAGDRELRIGRE